MYNSVDWKVISIQALYDYKSDIKKQGWYKNNFNSSIVRL